jgi:hypothetical protein
MVFGVESVEKKFFFETTKIFFSNVKKIDIFTSWFKKTPKFQKLVEQKLLVETMSNFWVEYFLDEF